MHFRSEGLNLRKNTKANYLVDQLIGFTQYKRGFQEYLKMYKNFLPPAKIFITEDFVTEMGEDGKV